MRWNVSDTLDYVDWSRPVNWDSGLNRGLLVWYLSTPGQPMGWGTARWRDLCHRYTGGISNIANPATATSGWTNSQNRRGGFGSLKLDGSNDDVTAGGFATTTSAYSVSCWIEPRSVTAGNIWISHDSVANNGWRIGDNSAGALRFAFGGVANYDFTTLTLAADVWHFVCVTCTGNSGTATGYVAATSGALLSEAKAVGTLSGTPTQLTIGRRGGGGAYSNVWIDDVRVWNRVLDEREVAQLRRDSMTGYNDTIRRVDPWLTFPDYAATVSSGGPFPWFIDDLSGGFQTLGMGSN